MVFSLLRTWGSLGSPLVGLSGALGSSGIFVALDKLDCLVVDMCILWWVGGGDVGWVVGWVGGKVGGRVGDIPAGRMDALSGGVSVEVLSRFLGFVLLVHGSRFVDSGRDVGGVPGRMGGGHCFLWVSDIDPSVTGDTPQCIFCAQVGCILGCHVPNLFPWVGGCHIPYGFHLLECCCYCYYRGLFLGKGSGILHCFVGLLVLCCFSGFLVHHNSFL